MTLLALHGAETSLVLERRDPLPPAWRWWGPRIDPGTLPPLAWCRAPASFSLDEDLPLTIAPEYGSGWFGAPALRAHREGRHFAQRFEVEAIEKGEEAIRILLIDAVAGIALEQRFALVGGAIEAEAAVTNRGDTPLAIDWLAAATLPLPADCAEILSFTGRHNAEFVPEREAMPAHAWLRENRRGLTGHAGPPGLFVTRSAADWHGGCVLAAQFAWSGNHVLRVDRDDEGCWTLQMGAALAPGEIVLGPGEQYRAPAMLATASTHGINGAIQGFHRAVRARLPWHGTMRARPVHLNSWEGFYFDHDEAALTALAERAAALGVERFVLDDGWFHRRDDDTRALGDWTPDARKYPQGLGPLAQHVVALGMEFGLWVEPEMINPDSDLYRAHPDWVLAVDGLPRRTARSQLVLDLGRPAVRDHLFAVLDRLLRTLPIAYLKWDHNRDLAPAGGADGRAGHDAQVRGAYALFARLRAAHPAVEIEACAGGGGRIDAGIARHTHRFWTSDCIDAVSRVRMQRGFLHFLPPEVMGAHVGASPAHSTGRRQDMAFRAAVALPGHFGVELDPAALHGCEAKALAHWIARYKALRDRLHQGDVWLGEGADGLVWQLHGSLDDALLSVTRVDPVTQRRPQPLPLPPLAGAGRVRVRLIDTAQTAGHPPPDAPLFAAMRGEGVVFNRDWLAQAGLPLPPAKAETLFLFDIRAA